MTYKNLKEYCENKYKKSVELSKKKQECPACGHKTFSFYEDDLNKAKCFHPSCGLHLNLNIINGNVDYRIIAADRFATKAHEYLFTQSQTGQPIQPFIYANKVRKISEDILKRSDVGANPVNYDARVENKDLIAEINKKIKKETSADKKEKLQTQLKNLEDFIEKLQKFINDNHGYLVFFYRDENELITQFKARNHI